MNIILSVTIYYYIRKGILPVYQQSIFRGFWQTGLIHGKHS